MGEMGSIFITVGGGNGVEVMSEGDNGVTVGGGNGVMVGDCIGATEGDCAGATPGGDEGGRVDAGAEGEEALPPPDVVDAAGGATFLWTGPSTISLEATGLDASGAPGDEGEAVVVIVAGLFSVWTRVLFLGLSGS